MTAPHVDSDTMTMASTKQHFGKVVSSVRQSRRRVVVEDGGVPVAAIVPTADLVRLRRLDAEWEEGFEILDDFGAAFVDADPDEIERETARALAEVRAEMRAEREAAKQHRCVSSSTPMSLPRDSSG